MQEVPDLSLRRRNGSPDCSAFVFLLFASGGVNEFYFQIRYCHFLPDPTLMSVHDRLCISFGVL